MTLVLSPAQRAVVERLFNALSVLIADDGPAGFFTARRWVYPFKERENTLRRLEELSIIEIRGSFASWNSPEIRLKLEDNGGYGDSLRQALDLAEISKGEQSRLEQIIKQEVNRVALQKIRQQIEGLEKQLAAARKQERDLVSAQKQIKADEFYAAARPDTETPPPPNE